MENYFCSQFLSSRVQQCKCHRDVGENDGKLHFLDKCLCSHSENLCTNDALCNALTLHFSIQLSYVFNRALIGMLLSSVEISVLAFSFYLFFFVWREFVEITSSDSHAIVNGHDPVSRSQKSETMLTASILKQDPNSQKVKQNIYETTVNTLFREKEGKKEKKRGGKKIFFSCILNERVDRVLALFVCLLCSWHLCDGLCNSVQQSLAVVKLSHCLAGNSDSGIWFETRSREGGVAAGFQQFSDSLFGQSDQECEWF